MDTYLKVERDIAGAFERWENRDAWYYEHSRLEFERLVDPRVCHQPHPIPEELLHCNLCYTEWFLFEFELDGRATPLNCFVEHPDAGTPHSRIERLRQVAQTQRFSHFAIRAKDEKTGTMRLLDLLDGKERMVCAPEACRHRTWELGTLSLRIACVDGTWIQAGKMLAYDRAHISPARLAGLKEPGHGGVAAGDEDHACARHKEGNSVFIDFLQDVIGVNGAYGSTFRLVA